MLEEVPLEELYVEEELVAALEEDALEESALEEEGKEGPLIVRSTLQRFTRWLVPEQAILRDVEAVPTPPSGAV